MAQRQTTIRFRTTVAVTCAAAVCSAIVATLTMLVVYAWATQHTAHHIAEAGRDTAYLVEHDQIHNGVVPSGDELVQVVSQGRVLASSSALVGKPPLTSFEPSGPDGGTAWQGTTVKSPTPDGDRLVVMAFRAHSPQGQVTVYSAAPQVPWNVNPWWPLGLSLGVMLVTAGAGAATWFLVGRALGPVEAIRTEMEEISASDLSRRVPVPEHGAEIIRLAATMNRTLHRLEQAVEQQRRFACDASHDLRSPLTAMRTELEMALLDAEDADWPATAGQVITSIERLNAIIEDLLELARLDAGTHQQAQPVDLSQLVAAEVERRPRRVAVHTHLEPGVVLSGDRLRLSRLLTNLLDNADRHAAARIDITVRRDGDAAVLEVLDDGDGIPVADRESVFCRFTRLDAARRRESGGTGLGLAIAREIATAHEGTLVVADSPQGARLVLQAPLGTLEAAEPLHLTSTPQ